MNSKKSKIIIGSVLFILIGLVLIKCTGFQYSGVDTIALLVTDDNYKKNLYISRANDLYKGMGMNYKINNLEKGIYEVKITAKEYEYGKLKKEYDLSEETVNYKAKAVALKVGINYGDGSNNSTFIQTLIKDTYSDEMEIGFFDNVDNGITLSIIEKDKKFELDKELAIAAYSKGSEEYAIEEIDIYDDYKVSENNGSDLIIFLELHKVD